MFKQAMRSYITSLHPRNFRKIKDTPSMLVWFIGVCVIMDIAIIKTRYKDAIEDVCNYEMMFDIAGKGVPLGQMLKL